MARPKADKDATGKLREDDKTQEAPKGTKIGLLKRGGVLTDFRKITKRKPT
jgi:hypothetical protein